MNLTGDLNTCIEQLNKTIDEIIPKISFRYGEHGFPLQKVRLSLDEFLQITLMRPTETIHFGRELNDQQHKWSKTKEERRLIELLRNGFWWPAVDGKWSFQCFEVKTENKYVNDIYLLVRIGSIDMSTYDPHIEDDIYWLGVKSQRCYLDAL